MLHIGADLLILRGQRCVMGGFNLRQIIKDLMYIHYIQAVFRSSSNTSIWSEMKDLKFFPVCNMYR